MNFSESTHLLLIPSYNTGRILKEVVLDALKQWQPVWLVIDGSNDKSFSELLRNQDNYDGLKVLVRNENYGKGSTVLWAAEQANKEGYTHVMLMDADGQHPSKEIKNFMQLSMEHPTHMIMGNPIFGKEAPLARILGRKLTLFWTDIETLWTGMGDTLFGFRVYPLKPLLIAFSKTNWARRFDFDPEIAVRIKWEGVHVIQKEVPVKYLSKVNGGVSHFNYIRDNLSLTYLHFRLIPEFLISGLWKLIWLKFKTNNVKKN